MTIFEILNLRYEFEEIVLNFKIPGDKKFGTLQNLKWFLKYSKEKNSKKNGYVFARKIAESVVKNQRK